MNIHGYTIFDLGYIGRSTFWNKVKLWKIIKILQIRLLNVFEVFDSVKIFTIILFLKIEIKL